MCEDIREGIENAPSADIDKPGANRRVDELRAFIAVLIEPDALAPYRLIVADGWRFPDVARVFEQSGMRAIRQRIADLLEAGGVPANQSRRVAAGVVALTLGDAYQHAVLGIVEAADGEVFARQIDDAVKYGLSWRAC
jgi:TetR/AcrR family transcriptional repressor of mexJK operon